MKLIIFVAVSLSPASSFFHPLSAVRSPSVLGRQSKIHHPLTATNVDITTNLDTSGGGGGSTSTSRNDFLKSMTALLVTTTAATNTSPQLATAQEEKTTIEPKQTNLSDEELKSIILRDVTQNSFLATADLTRSVYDESASFTDEIDTYTLQKWISGTKKLFVGEKSEVRLVGDVDVNKERVEFRFDEDLMFRIPLRPVVRLTGKVILDRDATSGLIVSYREIWDQDVGTVLRSAKF